ncbi:uncharacterized protein LOC130625181 [Hydractinia symbiolongicarpus]|uniref:uncharacterized protein LOC130625181 n=1 Tax=Hydractinia symbiolongicarpus TaxID=13093 RepID=UPI00254DF505|nr:uncharacterized protein LOC130625181 [Hydractinia symbiolongicarpus]
MAGGALINALAFSGTNFSFSKLLGHGGEERRRHDEWVLTFIVGSLSILGQLLWLRQIKGPKRIDYPHFTITTPNDMHQFDILYMPHDRVYGNTYKYILTRVDVASRYNVARPLRTKKVGKVADMIKDIYKAGPLRYPKIFQCDNGSEFKSDVTKLLEDKGVDIKMATTKYHHTFTAFVESYNKVLAERLLKPQDAQELVSEETSSIWVKNLYTIVKSLNNTKTAMISMKPNKVIKLD